MKKSRSKPNRGERNSDFLTAKHKDRHQKPQNSERSQPVTTQWVDRNGKVHSVANRKKSEGEQPKETPVSSSASYVKKSHFRKNADSHQEQKKDFDPKSSNKKFEIKKNGPQTQVAKDVQREPRQAKSNFWDEPNHPKKSGFKSKSERGSNREFRRDNRKERNPETIPGRYKAIVDKNKKGFGFLIFDNRKLQDAFIPPNESERLLHGDRVEVELDAHGKIKYLTVLEHRFRELVGKFSKADRGGWVLYERKKARERIFIEAPPAGLIDGWVRIKILFEKSKKSREIAGYFCGEIIEAYGADLPARADLPMVAGEFNLIEEHSEQAISEAKKYAKEFADSFGKGDTRSDPHRKDLRHIPFITIDGETARDFDDAVYVEKKGAEFVLWVAIADVSHYVTLGSALDKEARSRGTSVYFPERAFHMLPRELSENMCSLKPKEPRAAFAAKIVIDSKGVFTNIELVEALIESKRRATYNQIQEEYLRDGSKKDFEYAHHFELYHILRKVRSKRGSVDFDLPEVRVLVTPEGEPIEIKRQERFDAHRLIEEFMIAANEAVTQWILKKNWPFLFRVHENPTREALERFRKTAQIAGVKFAYSEKTLHQDIIKLIESLDGHAAQTHLNIALLRSMKQAMYSADYGKHFGLASLGYTHFTSPIRRYPDLVVHRVLRAALRGEKPTEQLEKDLAEIAEHCSYRERIASEAERESNKLKQIRALIPLVGNEFEGMVNGVIEGGLFVQLDDPYVEGMVPVDRMNDDYYIFDDEKMTLTGRRNRKSFRLGDRLHVKLARVNFDERKVEFDLLNPKGEKTTPANREKSGKFSKSKKKHGKTN